MFQRIFQQAAKQGNIDEFPIYSDALDDAFIRIIAKLQNDKNFSTKVLPKCKL